jgi:dTDP-3-amino-3,4,6-trideoxy-alpha-D-glucose transaminase
MTPIPFFDLAASVREHRPALIEAATRVIDSGHYILGRELAAFESDFAAFCGTRHAIGVGNGLDAITLILRALDIGPADEVIVPGHTFVATWLAVSQVGAIPVGVDIDPATFNIDPKLVPAAITSRTRAIIAVHLYGRAAQMAALAEIACAHGLALVEDAAQAHGAVHGGRRVGGLGTAAAFSFYPTKNLGALGDGGAVTTDDDDLAERVRTIRNYGSRTKYRHQVAGVNSRLDEVQAGFLAARLPHLEAENARRRAIAARYDAGLANVPGIVRPALDTDAVWHLYVIRNAARDALQQALADLGVGTLVHYPTPPYLQPVYAATHSGARLQECARAACDVLSLPLWPEMADDQVDAVIERLGRAQERLEHDAATGVAVSRAA